MSSSAKHHLGKLQELGIVSFDHNELINGITANYMKLNNVTIRIGQDIYNEFDNECDLFSKNLMSQIYSQYLDTIKLKRTKYPYKFLGEFVSGVVHMSDEKMENRASILSFSSLVLEIGSLASSFIGTILINYIKPNTYFFIGYVK